MVPVYSTGKTKIETKIFKGSFRKSIYYLFLVTLTPAEENVKWRLSKKNQSLRKV